MGKNSDLQFDVFGFDAPATSHADPEVLARAVRAHKAGDAFAQAAIAVALMLAIGAVAFVLSVDRAAAAGLVGHPSLESWGLAGAVALIGGTFLASRLTLKTARAVARRRHGR